jgi:hypothetical protein
LPFVSYRELRRIERDRREAVARADAAERWSRGLVNSFLTSKGQLGVPLPAPPSEKHYTPPPALPDTVQGWTQDEFVDTLTADGTYKSRGEAIEAWQSAQKTGKFPYQNNEEFLS